MLPGTIDIVPAVLITLSAVLGLAIGSFLNVVIHRVPAGLSVVRPASRCPSCGAPIRARQNIPVLSYLVLRGRCAACHAPIGVRYPLVEAATGLLFAGTTALAMRRSALELLPAWLYLVAIGVALAMIDLDVHRLPNRIVLPAYPVLAVLLTIATLVNGDGAALLRALIGGAGLFAFYLLLVLVYPAGMGWGDVKLAGVLGGALAYAGWSALLVGAFGGFLLGAVVAVVVMAAGRATRKTALPFGPFMLIGAAAGIVVGNDLGGLYWGALGL